MSVSNRNKGNTLKDKLARGLKKAVRPARKLRKTENN
jgi:hypothetical protein